VKTFTILALAMAFALAAPTLAFTQSNRPEDKGSTGWTGGSRDPSDSGDKTKGDEKTKGDVDTKGPESGTWYAEGSDLKGPPRQFPPGRPPE